MSDRNETFFEVEDTINIQRSQLPTQTFNHKTSFNLGELIPFYMNSDIYPGITLKNTTAILCRLGTLQTPIMDNIYLDTFYFWVPNQWLDPNWKALMGENEDGAWAVQTLYTTQKIVFTGTTNGTVEHNSILAYMGIPQGFGGQETNTMKIIRYPVNAYIRIYNYWFRDQNAIAPIKYNTDAEDLVFDSTNPITGGQVLKACKFRDYFTTALPEPQKGEPITLPLGTSAPVYTGSVNNEPLTNTGLRLKRTDGLAPANAYNQMTWVKDGQTNYGVVSSTGAETITPSSSIGLFPINLYTDLTQATAATINALRLAFATQQILEADARYGTMYQNVIRGNFGVTASNASLHIPEYLGGKRIPVNIETVLNTASDSGGDALGAMGGYSITFDVNEDFTKSFTEHGVIIGILVARQNHTYQQGINRMWTRNERLDYYFPQLAHIGNQPIYNYELYAQGTAEDNEVYGYKEAFAEFKYQPSRISGMLSSNYSAPLDKWHLGDDYSSLPVYGKQFLEETEIYLDRALDVTSQIADQFIADIEVTQEITAPMPVHCTPGMHIL